MKPDQVHRNAGFQKGFKVLSTDFSSLSRRITRKGEQVQHATTMTTSYKRPRPGRRRLSMHNLAPSLTQSFFLMALLLSILCMPIEAAEYPGSQGRAVKGNFVDGRILFDRNPVPLPTLQRRQDTDIASTTAAAEAPVPSSPDAPNSLPRPFDGGFGTNYTQPSCPRFLRSMVNNDTFLSCVPFSLLLGVCPSSLKKAISLLPKTNL